MMSNTDSTLLIYSDRYIRVKVYNDCAFAIVVAHVRGFTVWWLFA
jgi:hypothetical protein